MPHGLFPYKSHALMPLRHFTEHLVGARLGIKIHYRPRAISYKPPIQPNQARKQTKIAPHI